MADHKQLYAHYSEMKGWSGEAVAYEPATFSNLLEISGKSGSLDILEYGFGSGDFLDWARAAGHRAVGIEILPEAVAAAASRGHQVYLGAQDLPDGARFDLIMAADVLEHLDAAELAELLGAADRILKAGGVIVARFPNGDSPFFGRYQYGDFTHEKPLSSEAVDQLVMPHGFRVLRAVNPRPRATGFRRRLRRRIAYAIRNMIETVLGLAYFGYRTPMDPNIVVVIGRTSGPKQA